MEYHHTYHTSLVSELTRILKAKEGFQKTLVKIPLVDADAVMTDDFYFSSGSYALEDIRNIVRDDKGNVISTEAITTNNNGYKHLDKNATKVLLNSITDEDGDLNKDNFKTEINQNLTLDYLTKSCILTSEYLDILCDNILRYDRQTNYIKK